MIVMIRAKGIIAARDFGLEGFVGVEVEARHAAAARFELFDQIRQACDSSPNRRPGSPTARARKFPRLPAAPRSPARRSLCRFAFAANLNSPSREKTFCAAFSRMLHVL